MFDKDEMVLVTDITGATFKMPYKEALGFPWKVKIEEIKCAINNNSTGSK